MSGSGSARKKRPINSPPPLVARVIQSARVVTSGGVRPAAIHIEGGRIARISDPGPRDALGHDVIDAGDLIVMPGLVDTHVHVNDPGRTDWEGFATVTRAAAAGGVTTLLDMPLNSIPATTSVAALHEKAAAASGKTWVNVGFIGGVVPGNSAALGGLARGVLAFKCFLVPSGVPEFQHVTEADLREAMPVLAQLGLPLMVHAELPTPIEAATLEAAAGDPTIYATYLASRPPAAEHEAVALVILLAELAGARAHIVHVSSAESAAMVAHARGRGVRISAETCPHYLHFDAGQVPPGATEYKCAPPIRDAANRDALWAALRDGRIAMIVSDHSPCPPILKRRDVGDFFVAWGGIASLQLGASIVWTSMRERGLGIERLVEWMSAAPARLVGLETRKGRIAPGFDADVVIFDPDAERTVNAAGLLHRHPVTPYLGAALRGSVEATYVGGRLAFDRTRGPASEPRGELLLPSQSTRS